MDPAQEIGGAEKLVHVFGSWPSFHDAELLELRLERRGRDDFEGPVLHARFHVFKGRRDPDTQSGVRWYDHTQVTLRFGMVVDLDLSGFNHQNAIFDLRMESGHGHPATPSLRAYRVTIEPSFGVGGSFLCASIEVTDVERGLPPGSVYAE